MAKKYLVSLHVEEIIPHSDGEQISKQTSDAPKVPPLNFWSFDNFETAIDEMTEIYNSRMRPKEPARYEETELIKDIHIPRILEWASQDQLVGIHDKHSGVIIMFTHKKYAEAIVRGLTL